MERGGWVCGWVKGVKMSKRTDGAVCEVLALPLFSTKMLPFTENSFWGELACGGKNLGMLTEQQLHINSTETFAPPTCPDQSGKIGSMSSRC